MAWLIISASTRALSATAATRKTSLTLRSTSVPKTSTWLATLDSSATARTAKPARTSRRKLRTRLTTGFSRLLRGTAQAALTTFCAACPRPTTPYSAASEPTTTADALPWSPSGRPSWVPTIGNWLSAEDRMSRSSSSLPWSTKPSTEDAISSSGKIATKA